MTDKQYLATNLHPAAGFAWSQYDALCRAAAGDGARSEASDAFETRGFHIGHMPSALARRIEQVALGLPVVPWRPDLDRLLPCYFGLEPSTEQIEEHNRFAWYREATAELRWLIADAFESIRDEVARCLASPWRVLNMRIYGYPYRADRVDGVTDHGSCKWHTDGFYNDIFKILLYFTPLDRDTGGLELREGDGTVKRVECAEPGTWVLFMNSAVLHRGVAPTKPGTERMSAEVTVARSLRFDLMPHSPGVFAAFPLYPWIDKDHAVRINE